ncbi:MAG: hypothetical protein ABL866_14140 [Devosia sp.]
MSQLVRAGLGAQKGGRTWESLVGYSVRDLAKHLERQFLPGMTWQNMGDWEIDHIVPRATFSYRSVDDPDFRACWAMNNLRPLWADQNRSKSAKRLFLI